MTSQYSPFVDKELKELDANDLNTLLNVSEGWYVEYKRELPNPKAIAKSISAFSNTYGGWLFVGVAEDKKSDNVAGSCPGIPEEKMDAALQSIRQSAANHLSPCPYFETKVLLGPNESMGLNGSHGVICVEVPLSPLAPIVHSSGLIYRRVSDGSEPRRETDRHLLELLWKRRDKIHEEYRHWIEREPERSKGEGEGPYLRLLLEADLYRARGQHWNLSLDEIKESLDDKSSGIHMPLETIHHSGLGIVARQTSNLNRHEDFGLTWVLGRGLRCEVWLPIQSMGSLINQHESHSCRYSTCGQSLPKRTVC